MASKVFQLMLVLGAVAVISVSGQRNIALSGPEFRRLRLGQNPELLQYAAMTLETVTIVIDGPEVLAVVQEDVNANFWCLPWLQRFPGGSIRWLFQRREVDTGEPVPGSILAEVSANDPLVTVGGDFNEWLNVTGTILVLGAASTSNGLYVCEVCLFRGTQFEECHLANTSLQVIGGPPFLDIAPNNDPSSVTTVMGNITELEYLIGSDFCIAPDYRGTVTILCVIINAGQPNPLNISRAFPVPSRSWSLNEDLLYSEISTGTPNIVDSTEFFSASVDRMVLMPQYFFPESVLGTPTVGRLQGAIQLNFALFNASFAPLFGSLEAAQAAAYRAVVGDWTCGANNTFGSDMATSSIRICGEPPNIQRCSELTFGQSGQTIPVGCTVCIPEGAVITLDCSGTSASDVFYEWRSSDGSVVSTSPLFSTGVNDNFTCTATNLDNSPEFAVSVIAYSDAVTFTTQTTESFSSVPRMDNGCPRLRNPELQENTSICAFVGETLDLSCVTDDNDMVPLEITAPNGVMATGSLSVSNVNTGDAGSYQCRLSNTEGPCGAAVQRREVEIFDPATIDREAPLPIATCTYGVGRRDMVEFQPAGSTVTLCCPYNGIEEPERAWYRITVNDLGCASEVLVQDVESITMIEDDEVNNILRLTARVDSDVTYVCRVSNRAGSDADIVSITTTADNAPFWSVTGFSACSLECQDGVRRQSVVCRSGTNNMILPQNMCDLTARPNSEETCSEFAGVVCLLDPVWIHGEWAECSKNCDGFRERDVKCIVPMTGEERPAFECSQLAKPIDFDTLGCPKCCIEDLYSIYCKIGGSAGFCSQSESFRSLCCWTCGDITIGG